ncbi:MAG TPA: acyl-CoA thioesterase [Anaerolineales bacterium]|nr:acyl-CoA thioesterase [Anaerolineales bacterium]
MNNVPFKIEMEVRDYECDIEGIVNNAVYLNYLEHARHLFIRNKGFDFAQLSRQGILLVVIRVEADFLYPLRSGDRFYVTASLERISKLRFGFLQDIFRMPDNKPILKAKVFGTSLNAAGQPKYFEELEKIFSNEM